MRHVSAKLKLHTNIHLFSTVAQITRALPKPSTRNIYILDLVIDNDEQAGLKLSQKIRQFDLKASIIFLTAHDELLPTTYRYQVEALDFIVKDPQKVEGSLERDLSRVLQKIALPKEGKTIALRSHYEIIKVPINDILFFQSDQSNTRGSFLYTIDNSKRPINMSLHELEGQVEGLFRVHRSYLVNLVNIKSVDVKKREVRFIRSEMVVPVSRLRIHKLIAATNNSSIQC